MSLFTVRVELHSADWSDYESLHGKMVTKGFSQKITSGDGKNYKLPPAEYTYVGSDSKQDVLAKAKAAAAQVKPSYAVVVTESAGTTWYGLEVA